MEASLENKNIIILSEKSSGSSALMKYLLRYENIHAVQHTRHNERETLYWTKAASVLGRPQKRLVGSEVPIPKIKAKNQLMSLLKNNVPLFEKSPNNYDTIFKGWEALCKRYGPVFLEKSPHYLANWSNVELMLDCIEHLENVECLIVGLIRHPLNTIHSYHRRWKLNPGLVEKQWVRSYENLKRLKQTPGVNLTIVKYEDMIKSTECLKPVITFAGYKNLKESSFRPQRKIKNFNYELDNWTKALSREYGYEY